jgi:serine/threonine protein kinase
MPQPAFHRVEDLFHQAVALDPVERPSFLDQACGGDAKLREAVLDLLQHHAGANETDDYLIGPWRRMSDTEGRDARTQPDDILIGEPPPPEVPGYTLLGELGRGGMGVVYKARQGALNRVVALKMLLSLAPIRPDQLARFRAEAEALARLHHPNVIPIFEFGECDGRPFFTMAYVPGPSLDRVIDGRAQDIGRSAQLVEALARAVHAVHRSGIIHRDLKPANVLLAPVVDGSAVTADTPGHTFPVSAATVGVPMISDFGLAMDQAAARRLTESGATIGTPAYMAPEQVRGLSGTVGPATDVYALGSILYEMLTGHPPFDGATPAETIAQVLRDEPLSPSQLRPRLPRDLVTVCLKCLEKSPRQRYASALDLAEDLRRFQAGEPIRARPVSRVERAYRWCLRQPLAATLLGLCGLLTTAFIVSVLAYNASLKDALATVEELAEGRRRQIVELNITIGTDELEHGDGFAALLRFTEALRLEDGDRDRERPHRARIAGALSQCPRMVSLATLDKPVVSVSTHAPETLLEAVCDGTEVEVRDVLNSRRVGPALAVGASPVSGEFSPDGRMLATIGEDGVAAVWDSRTGTPRRLPGNGREPARRLAFLAEGRTLLIGYGESALTLWDVTTPVLTPLLELPAGSVRLAAQSENGRWLFTASSHGSGQVWDATTGKAAGSPVRPAHSVTGAALSPDGRTAAFASAAGAVSLWDVTSNRPLGSAIATGGPVSDVIFSPEGDRVLTAGTNCEVRIWRVSNRELAAALPRHGGAIRHVRFSPDGGLLVTAGDSSARAWDATSGKPVTPSLRQGAPFASVAFGKGSRQVITVGRGGTTCIWELLRPEQSDRWVADLAIHERPPDYLKALAQLFANGRIDETQTRVGLDSQHLRAHWQRLQIGR